MTSPELDTRPWWRDACIYEVYPRSFADSDGDGVGDLPGLIARLPYLASLGIDALWLCPWYPSPLRDGGYDVVDHRAIHPLLGDLDDADRLIEAAHTAGLRIIIDVVPNHTSDEHPWFRAAVEAGPGAEERARYHIVPGDDDGAAPPNDWQSLFGGPAWTQLDNGDWYLHLFDSSQPDLDWSRPEVADHFDDVLRFWLARGVDGIRVDVANGLVKAEGYPDAGPPPDLLALEPGHGHPHWDRPGVHDIARRWRSVVDDVDRPVLLLAESWVGTELLGDYLRPGEYHQAFNFSFLFTGWDRDELLEAVEQGLAATDDTGAAPTWMLSNHDVMRHATRFGLPPGTDPSAWALDGDPALLDPALGLRRARAATLLMLALPGCSYLYQGEELGLPEAYDLPVEALQDPTWERSGHTDRGRDGCRVPLPWDTTGPSYGFSSVEGWLPQPDRYRDHAVAVQSLDPASTLSLYRRAIAVRRALLAGVDEDLTWLDLDRDVLAFRRGRVTCVVNLGDTPIALPAGEVVVASSTREQDDQLPPDTAAWVLGDRAPVG